MRLGFTWDGLNLKISEIINPSVYFEGDNTPLLLNRLRPIPIYASVPPLLGVVPGYSSSIYTADSYANLVYSSIIALYCTAVGVSSYDTMRDAALLALIPIQCPTLGVVFYQKTLSNTSTRIIKDLYSLTFELRNELDEPYHITNNGVVTLELGLTYAN